MFVLNDSLLGVPAAGACANDSVEGACEIADGVVGGGTVPGGVVLGGGVPGGMAPGGVMPVGGSVPGGVMLGWPGTTWPGMNWPGWHAGGQAGGHGGWPPFRNPAGVSSSARPRLASARLMPIVVGSQKRFMGHSLSFVPGNPRLGVRWGATPVGAADEGQQRRSLHVCIVGNSARPG